MGTEKAADETHAWIAYSYRKIMDFIGYHLGLNEMQSIILMTAVGCIFLLFFLRIFWK